MDKLPAIYLGEERSPTTFRLLKAGDLECLYLDGAIRHINAGGKEILRGIYPAVRDPNWRTVQGTISGERIGENEDSFSVHYNCRYSEGNIDYLVLVQISCTKDNSLIFSMKGEAMSSFEKNRIGLNILHPIAECTGRKCAVTTPEGKEYGARFPMDVSPFQPMKNIRSLAWTLEGGIHANILFSGEVFEMEDQRNWTDASYKTYCTPLELPFPVRLEPGEILEQEVQLKVEVRVLPPGRCEENRVCLHETHQLEGFPALGIGRSRETDSLESREIDLIRELGLQHYRVDLYLYQNGWEENLASAVREANALGLALELGLFFGDEVSIRLEKLIDQLKTEPCPVDRFLVFTREHLNNADLSHEVIPALRMAFPGTRIGTGTNANFAELNRNRPDPELPDFLTYSINPQVHATDPLSLVENLSGQKDTVLTARNFPGSKPVCISPVTLRSRFNIVATSEEAEDEGRQSLPDYLDPRQPSLFCAGWTLGSFKYLAEAGVDSITYYETTGRGGILHGDHPPLSPEDFLAQEGDVYPVYFLLRELLKYQDHQVRPSTSSHPLRFSSLLLEGDNEKVLLLANHTTAIQLIKLPESTRIQSAWMLDEDTLTDHREDLYGWEDPVDPSSVSLNPIGISFLKLK